MHRFEKKIYKTHVFWEEIADYYLAHIQSSFEIFKEVFVNKIYYQSNNRKSTDFRLGNANFEKICTHIVI